MQYFFSVAISLLLRANSLHLNFFSRLRASALEIVQDRATPERLERGWNVLSEFVARNVGDGGAYIYLSKGTASRSLNKLLRGPHDQYEREMEANETEASSAGFFAWLEKNDKAV